ncbi:Myotubularin phosphatase domain [Nakaseomyces glabratus]
MEYIKISKVDDVTLHRRGKSAVGTLHLTTHHLIFESPSLKTEFWFAHHLIGSVFKNYGSALLSVPGYDINATVGDKDLWSMTNVKIIGKDFTVFSLDFLIELEANEFYDSLMNLTVLEDPHKLYAYIYKPNELETKLTRKGWDIYDLKSEFLRQGLDLDGSEEGQPTWRVSNINANHEAIPTYPAQFVVPALASDPLLLHAMKFRSQNRLPVLAYYYKKSQCCLLRSSQPLTGVTKQRSLQDEKLIQTFFKASNKCKKNLIVDARPTANALAQMALGGGTESMDNYNFNKTVQRLFLGIDNIHVMSDTLNSLVDNVLADGDIYLPISDAYLSTGKSANWLKYVKLLLSSTDMMVKSMVFNQSNILLHCSDGWDRTTQVASLVQICLDPYFRTLEGFMVLIEKDWVSFGHKFKERLGHLSSTAVFHDNTSGLKTNVTLSYKKLTGKSKAATGTTEQEPDRTLEDSTSLFGNGSAKDNLNKSVMMLSNSATDFFNKTIKTSIPYGDSSAEVDTSGTAANAKTKKKASTKFVSPVFMQFLDCVYQLLLQNPEKFEYNERFLRRLLYHAYSCQYGTFLYNNEKERMEDTQRNNTNSVWDYFNSRKLEFTNVSYQGIPEGSDDWILPDLGKVRWWWQLFGRRNSEMNGYLDKVQVESKVTVDENSKEDTNEGTDNVKTLGEKIAAFSFDFFGKK